MHDRGGNIPTASDFFLLGAMGMSYSNEFSRIISREGESSLLLLSIFYWWEDTIKAARSLPVTEWWLKLRGSSL